MLCLPFGAKTVSALPRKCLVENFPLITKISFTSAQDLVLDRILFSKQMRHFGPWVGGGEITVPPTCSPPALGELVAGSQWKFLAEEVVCSAGAA